MSNPMTALASVNTVNTGTSTCMLVGITFSDPFFSGKCQLTVVS